MLEEYPDVLTVEHLQDILCVGKSTTYRLLKSGLIKHFKIGKQIRIPKGCLIDYITSTCYDSTM